MSLAFAARATTRINFGTGVTNPLTRDAGSTASAIATVQVVSGGRAMLGIDCGDSAAALIGQTPASVTDFETYIQRVQGYLCGEDVAFGHSALSALELGSGGNWKNPWLLPKEMDNAAMFGASVRPLGG